MYKTITKNAEPDSTVMLMSPQVNSVNKYQKVNAQEIMPLVIALLLSSFNNTFAALFSHQLIVNDTNSIIINIPGNKVNIFIIIPHSL